MMAFHSPHHSHSMTVLPSVDLILDMVLMMLSSSTMVSSSMTDLVWHSTMVSLREPLLLELASLALLLPPPKVAGADTMPRSSNLLTAPQDSPALTPSALTSMPTRPSSSSLMPMVK